jgi:VanZ like family
VVNKPDHSVLVPALILVVAGIVYGSTFPFRFDVGLASGSFTYFLDSWKKMNSIGDLLGNLVLFFPYGYLSCLVAQRSERPVQKAVVLVFLGCLLALACQLIQLISPDRDPAVFDLYINALGASLGWFAARLLPLGSSGKILGAEPAAQLALAVALLFPVSHLLPLVPSIDLQLWKDSLKPLLLYPRFRWQEGLIVATAGAAFLQLLATRIGWRMKIIPIYLGIAALCVLKVIIVKNHLNLSTTVGLMLSPVLLLSVQRYASEELLGWLLLIVFSIYAIAPLVVHQAPQQFGWLPFQGYLQGSMLVNAIALTHKSFIFAALVLFLVDGKPTGKHRVVYIAGVLLLLEILQRWVGFGTPALTDPLLFIAIAWFIGKQMKKYRNIMVPLCSESPLQ